MEGFNRIIKMKTGGSVSKEIAAYEKRERKSEQAEDIKQDKAIVKKAIAIHDKQEHPGEKTDLSKLKKGGRAKKEKGTVKKYKAGGAIEMKKTAGDIDKIKSIKLTGAKKAAAPSKASTKASEIGAKTAKASGALDSIKKVKPENKTAEAPSASVEEAFDAAPTFCKGGKTAKYKTGGKVKKMADGSSTGQGMVTDAERQRYAQAQQDFPVQKAEAARARARARNLATLSPAQQAEFAAQQQQATQQYGQQQPVQGFNGGGMVPGMGVGQASGPMGIAAPNDQFQPSRQPLPRTGY